MSTYKSNLQQAMSDNLLSLIQNADSREVIYPVFSFKRDTEKDGMAALRTELLCEGDYEKILAVVNTDWLPFELRLVTLVGKNEVEIKIVREAEAHLNSDYFNVFVVVDNIPRKFFEIAMNVETGFYSVNHEYEVFDEGDDSVFDAVSELFALDVRPHLIPLPIQGSFCINLD